LTYVVNEGGFRREVQRNECSGSPGKGQIFLPPSPPSAGFRGCEGGSGERKIEKVQSAQALHFASEFRESCIKCKYMDCVEVCPVDCFYEGENMLVIHPDECIDCGVIQQQPLLKPRFGIGLDRVDWAFGLATEYAKIWPVITVKKSPPPDAKEWEERPDKLQYFSPNPGAGD
jgi:ferredoxin